MLHYDQSSRNESVKSVSDVRLFLSVVLVNHRPTGLAKVDAYHPHLPFRNTLKYQGTYANGSMRIRRVKRGFRLPAEKMAAMAPVHMPTSVMNLFASYLSILRLHRQFVVGKRVPILLIVQIQANHNCKRRQPQEYEMRAG